MSRNMNDNNQAEIAGMIVDKCVLDYQIYGEKFYKFRIDVPRLSGTSDLLPVVVSDRLIDPSTILPGRYIKVKGQYRSYNTKKLDASVKNKQKLVVFSSKVELLQPGEKIDNTNKIELTGFVCKKPLYRTTMSKREICDIILAVNRAHHKSDYIPIILWGRNAVFASKFNIGDCIKIEGRAQQRDYDKTLEDGQVDTRTAYEVSVSKVELIAKKK